MVSATLSEKRTRLLERIASFESVAVAFSGGVDSAVVAKAAALVLGDRAVAVTAVSPSLASGERENAIEVARQIGIRHRLVETHEFDNADYLRNAPNRCYFCKTELYSHLAALRDELGFETLLNGANLDDRGDHRPGMQAAREYAVDSPLLETGLNKADVRDLARDWNLPVWDKPASPCLSSRIAYGLAVTPERIKRIDDAERFLKELLQVDVLRVRHEQNDLARIEIGFEHIAKLAAEEIRTAITAQLHALGFRYITLDLDGFRSGSLNEALLPEQLQLVTLKL